jgi:hypothetical protein
LLAAAYTLKLDGVWHSHAIFISSTSRALRRLPREQILIQASVKYLKVIKSIDGKLGSISGVVAVNYLLDPS